jgi:molecular chaperone DnaK (HSP70)
MWDKNDSGLSQKDFDKNYLSIYNKAEDVKKEFSLTEKVDFSIPNFITPSGNMAVEFEITRNEFDSAIAEKRKEAIDLVKNLLANSGVKHTDIDEVVLAGGSSNIVSIREALKDTLGIDSKANKDTSTVISEGAILKAESDWGEGIVEKTKIINNTLYDFGVKLAGNKFFPLIPEGTTLPFSISKDFSTERDNQEEIKIEIFRKNGKLYPVANRIVDDGIEFVDSLTIENVPPRRVGEITVTVEFELTKDDTLSVDVSVKDRDGSEIGNKTTISKGSNG